MTDAEFQTVTDLQRVRLIKAELDALEASSNVAESRPDPNATAMSNVRLVMREWERVLRERRIDSQEPHYAKRGSEDQCLTL